MGIKGQAIGGKRVPLWVPTLFCVVQSAQECGVSLNHTSQFAPL